MTFDEQTKIKFWGNVEKSPDPDGCWIFTGHKIRGYGQFWAEGRNQIAHRFSWMLINGEIPPGIEIHHTCGNRSCVNPAHLEAVDHQQNMKEAAKRGAWAGERNVNAKRTDAEVKAIRLLRSFDIPAQKIADKMGIPNRSVYYCLEGWRHLEPDPITCEA